MSNAPSIKRQTPDPIESPSAKLQSLRHCARRTLDQGFPREQCWRLRVWCFFGVWSLVLGVSLTIFAAEPTVDSKDLPRIPPTEPDKALSTFRIKPGFQLELVAAEPLVVDPIAM